MGLVDNFKTNSYKILIAVLIGNFISWLSIFLYGMFYYLYIPPVDHVRAVHFQFDPICKNYSGCYFPTASVALTLRGRNQILCRGQKYMVLIELEMPESESNQEIGMFMIKANMTTKAREVLRSASRPAIMHYKSWLYRLLQATFYSPFLFTGSYEEKQLLTVVLFEAYEENPHNVTTHIILQVQNPKIEIYTSTLKIHATFTGLRYYMFYWPMTTGFVGISTIFFFLSLIALFSWYHYMAAAPPPYTNGFLHSPGSSQNSSYGDGGNSSKTSEGFEPEDPPYLPDESPSSSTSHFPAPGDNRSTEIRKRVRHLLHQHPADDGGTFQENPQPSDSTPTFPAKPKVLNSTKSQESNIFSRIIFLFSTIFWEYVSLVFDTTVGIVTFLTDAVRAR